MTTATDPTNRLAGEAAQSLLLDISNWGKVTTIVLHGGSVFEFKGNFPKGNPGHGYYNLTNDGSGFEGHLNLNAVDHIAFQDKPHRGQESYAFVFNDKTNQPIFKIFLGRDEKGQLIREQKAKFLALRDQQAKDAS